MEGEENFEGDSCGLMEVLWIDYQSMVKKMNILCDCYLDILKDSLITGSQFTQKNLWR